MSDSQKNDAVDVQVEVPKAENAPFVRYLAELFGTFGMVLVGTGSIVLDQYTEGRVTHLGVSLSFGIVVAAMVYLLGKVSGAHINPAVSLGFWITGKLRSRDLPGYLVVQITGAILASGVLYLFFWSQVQTLGETLPADGVSVWQAWGLEFLSTFLLMLVILELTFRIQLSHLVTALLIGLTIGLAAYFAGPYCGASLNPARSIGPALLSGKVEHLWVYLIAPIAGALVAVGMCRAIHQKQCCVAC